MLFSSYIFILFLFPLAVIGYHWLNHIKKYHAALIWLVAVSMVFYGYSSIACLLLLTVGILINHTIVTFISKSLNPTRRKLWMWTGILTNLGVLFYFKYYNFFLDNMNAVFGLNLPLLQLVLPLGISFYTFKQLSYVIDTYRGECEKYGFWEYTAYISFFPQLISGPIGYHSELIPQFRDPALKKLDYNNLCKGLYSFAMGLSKKVLIADTFAKVVNIGYANVPNLNAPSALLVMLCYSLQIYFDFSGYCDMADGVCYMLNFSSPLNFNSPYKALSISDFWDRWHMTLTRFFTKYVYIPLGGSRRGTFNTYRNIMLVFLVSGLWHGANWTFILWGVLHGLFKVIERLLPATFSKVPKAIKLFTTFILVTFLWSLFRAESISQTFILWGRLFTLDFGPIYQPITEAFMDLTEMKVLYRLGLNSIMDKFPWVFLALFTLSSMTACFTWKNTREKAAEFKFTFSRLITVVILMVWSILSLSEMSSFLYFNF